MLEKREKNEKNVYKINTKKKILYCTSFYYMIFFATLMEYNYAIMYSTAELLWFSYHSVPQG
jgi:hypothetical protein